MARLLHVPPSTCEFVAKLAFNDPDTVFDVDMQMSWDHTLVADIPFEVQYTVTHRTNSPFFYAFAGEACSFRVFWSFDTQACTPDRLCIYILLSPDSLTILSPYCSHVHIVCCRSCHRLAVLHLDNFSPSPILLLLALFPHFNLGAHSFIGIPVFHSAQVVINPAGGVELRSKIMVRPELSLNLNEETMQVSQASRAFLYFAW